MFTAPSRRRAWLAAAAAVAGLLAGTVAAVPAAGPAAAQPSPSPSPDPVERSLRAATGVAVEVARDRRGRVRSITAPAGRGVRRAAGVPADPAAAARDFTRRFGGALGVRDAARELRVERVRAVPSGSVVRMRQLAGGLPVVGGEVVTTLDAAGAVESVAAETVDAPAGAVARVSAARAAGAARAVTARADRVPAARLTATTPSLAVLDPAVLGAPDAGGARTVWQVEVSGGTGVRRVVFVDAATGRVVLHASRVMRASQVCDARNTRTSVYRCPADLPVTRSATTGPSAVADVEQAYGHAQNNGDWLRSTFNRDGIDGAGMTTSATARWCSPDDLTNGRDGVCVYDNAFWDGSQLVFGPGMASADDVVGHEMAHGVIEHTSNLFYAYQSGAINESLSDVFGELFDTAAPTAGDTAAKRWLVGEDLGIGTIRDMRNPPAFRQPDRMTSDLWAADPDYRDAGGVHTNSGVGNKTAFLITDGGTFNGRTVRALGAAKAAQLYYRVTLALTSGSDYADLGRALQAQCSALVGQAGFTTDDCAQVAAAAAATELDRQPTVPGAAAPEATAGCPTGWRESALRPAYDFESEPVADAMFDGVTGGFGQPEEGWFVLPGYAHGGRQSAVALEPADGSAPMSRSLRLAGVAVPVGQRSYLRFDHVFDLEPSYAGGTVEYSLDGATWTDAGSLVESGQRYNATVTGAGVAAFSGFGGTSNGYVSTRVDLTSLAGRTVHLRFRLRSDPNVAYTGWAVDDVALTSCGAPAASAPASMQVAPGFGAATVSWTPPAWGGTTPITGYKVSWSGNSTGVTAPASDRSLRITGLPYGAAVNVYVQAVNGAGPGAYTRVSLLGSRVAVSAPRSLGYGARATIGATLTSTTGARVPSALLELWAAPYGKPATLVSRTRTDSTGAGRFYSTPTVTTRYWVRHPGGGTLLGAQTGVTVPVAPAVTSALSATTVRRGTAVTLSGAVSPAHAGAAITVQRSTDGRTWANLTSTRLSSTSRYAARFTASATAYYRGVLPAHADHAAGTSPARRLAVS